MHRMKLGFNSIQKQTDGVKKKPRAPRAPRKRSAPIHSFKQFGISKPPQPLPESDQPLEFLGIEFADLNSWVCHYPRGDAAPFTFCGQPVRNYGESWCSGCRALVYSRPSVRPAAPAIQEAA